MTAHHERPDRARRLPPVRRHVPVVSDYARNAVRVAAINACTVLLVYTHDSIGLGEDGPTHQPSRSTLRRCARCRTCTSGVPVTRWSRAVSWVAGLRTHKGPTALIFTRQGAPQQARTPEQLVALRKGRVRAHRIERAAGSVRHRDGGSEVGMRRGRQGTAGRGRRGRLVSMPMLRGLDSQPAP